MTVSKNNNTAADQIKSVFGVLDQASEEYRRNLETWLESVGIKDAPRLAEYFDTLNTYREMLEQCVTHPVHLATTEVNLLKDHARLLFRTGKRLFGKAVKPVVQPEAGDRRFGFADWQDNTFFDYVKQAYLLNSRAFMDLVDHAEDSGNHTHDQFVFYARQLVNALAPTNFLLTNPEALKKTVESGGTNLLDGVKQFWTDLKRNPQLLNVSMTDLSAFSVGRNVATTAGKVVFQNDMMQLIQYSPTTEQVHKVPLLVIPPWINKFYILDLKEKNSLIRWLVDQGFTVFVISWVNPGPSLGHKHFADYMLEGPVAAIDAIAKATGEKQVNAIGYCVGGTLLGCTLAWLAAKNKHPVKSATYLTSLLDFSDPGDIRIFINEKSIQGIEKRMNQVGYFDGRVMAFSFNMLRENDLFWSFFVNNYLKGEKPTAFDLLYWNSDSTNLPATMHSFYLRNMYLHNRLIEPNGIELAGQKIDLGKIDIPVYFLSTQQDHIAKWKTTYKGTQVHSGEVTFVLAGSGHIAGVVNPPSQNKYGYWTNEALPAQADDWFNSSTKHDGSWWTHWLAWAAPKSGAMIPAREPGSGGLPVIEDAPGSYVRTSVAQAIRQ